LDHVELEMNEDTWRGGYVFDEVDEVLGADPRVERVQVAIRGSLLKLLNNIGNILVIMQFTGFL